MNEAEDWAGRGRRLEQYLRDAIPLAAHMQVRVAQCDADGLALAAPLAPNINHKLSAFGGSLTSLATLAGWGILWQRLEGMPDVHIVVSESHMRYLHPVTQDISAQCARPADEVLDRFAATLTRRGRARLELEARIAQDGKLCAEFHGVFVAYRHTQFE